MKNIIFAVLFSMSVAACAQSGFVSAGGNLQGAGGSMSYSYGQLDYTVIESNNFYIQFGIHHMLIETDVNVIDPVNYSDDIIIYPNPTSGVFNVKLPEVANNPYAIIEVLNTRGDIVGKDHIEFGALHRFDLSGHAAGIYVIRIVYDGEVSVFRVLKR